MSPMKTAIAITGTCHDRPLEPRGPGPFSFNSRLGPLVPLEGPMVPNLIQNFSQNLIEPLKF